MRQRRPASPDPNSLQRSSYGWRSPTYCTAAFTLQAYAHVTEGMRRDSAAHMNSYIEKVMPKNAAETA